MTLLGDRRSDRDQAVEIDLSGTELRGLHPEGSDFGWTDLGGADLSGASLFNVDFRSSWLTEAKLARAYLWGTNLSDADMYDAALTNARSAQPSSMKSPAPVTLTRRNAEGPGECPALPCVLGVRRSIPLPPVAVWSCGPGPRRPAGPSGTGVPSRSRPA
ncbi:pentapeptide repeat-containing protein [Streptomyces sp. NPDC006482]|uniref:pentapeptide repeat-containing protein n=1 Tax=Streptomyces sp. NPDC006482 TaxID=3154306 RepID=UPI0033A546B3